MPGSNSGKCDRLQALLRGNTKRMGRRTAESVGRRLAAEWHARRVNHMMSFELSSRVVMAAPANGNGADLVALGLYPRAAFALNGAGNATAQSEIVIGGVHDRAHVHFREVAL